MEEADEYLHTDLSEDDIQYRSSLVGNIVDALLPWPGTLPYDLYQEFLRVSAAYRQVLTGAITDPTEADAITDEFNTWSDRAKRAIEQRRV